MKQLSPPKQFVENGMTFYCQKQSTSEVLKKLNWYSNRQNNWILKHLLRSGEHLLFQVWIPARNLCWCSGSFHKLRNHCPKDVRPPISSEVKTVFIQKDHKWTFGNKRVKIPDENQKKQTKEKAKCARLQNSQKDMHTMTHCRGYIANLGGFDANKRPCLRLNVLNKDDDLRILRVWYDVNATVLFCWR